MSRSNWPSRHDAVEGWDAWLAAVDAAIRREIGLTHRDLADFPYRDAFDSEEDPEVVAMSVLFEEGFL